MNTSRLLAAALVLTAFGCGDDDDSTSGTDPTESTTTTAASRDEYPACPAPGETVTEELSNEILTSGCLLGDSVVIAGRQDYDNGCSIVIWSNDGEGSWAVVGDAAQDTTWDAFTDDPNHVNPCETTAPT